MERQLLEQQPAFWEVALLLGCAEAQRLRSGFAVDAAEVSVALALLLLLLLLGDTAAPVTGAPRCVGLPSSSLLLSPSSESLAALAEAVD